MENKNDLDQKLKDFAKYLIKQGGSHSKDDPFQSIAGSFNEEEIAREYENTLKKFYELFPEAKPKEEYNS